MKKKLLTAALCLAVSFALSACGGNGADGTTAGKTDAATEGASQADQDLPGQPVQIRLW